MYSYTRLVLSFFRNRSRAALWFLGVRRFATLAIVLCVFYAFVYYSSFITNIREPTESYPESIRKLIPKTHEKQTERATTIGESRKQRIDKQTLKKVLLVVDAMSDTTTTTVRVLLEAQRVPFSTYHLSKKIVPPELMKKKNGELMGLYSLIIVTNGVSFSTQWDSSVRDHLMNYCRQFNTTVVLLFSDGRASDKTVTVGEFTSYTVPSLSVLFLEPNPHLNFFYLKSGKRVTKLPSHVVWNVFEPPMSRDGHVISRHHMTLNGSQQLNHILANEHDHRVLNTKDIDSSSHEPTKESHMNVFTNQNPAQLQHVPQPAPTQHEILLELAYTDTTNPDIKTVPIAIKEQSSDGILKYLIGGPVNFWLLKLLLLDVVRSGMGGREGMRFGRERWVMVDIDDIFVAPEGLKMTGADVRVGL